ncbi:MAG: hypothetical protein U0800_11200 [Isosphaeraceae bacterium]
MTGRPGRHPESRAPATGCWPGLVVLDGELIARVELQAIDPRRRSAGPLVAGSSLPDGTLRAPTCAAAAFADIRP